MKTVAITGGMGAGKSTACKAFEALGIPVFDTDSAVKNLYTTQRLLKIQMIGVFGEDIYLEDGSINRKKLASIIFSDRDKWIQISAIIHPFLMAELDEWKSKQKSPFVLVEAAIIYELGSQKQYDKVIYVYVDEKERVKRIKSRDGLSEEDIQARLKFFLPDDEKAGLADFVVHNEDSFDMAGEVQEIYQELCK